MKEFENKNTILWDFDGVILDSMEVREQGFREVLAEYPTTELEALLKYHKENGGLSRYVKFRYFIEEIRGEEPNEGKVRQYATAFSNIMRKLLTSKERLIVEVRNFIESNHLRYQMHIVSGSDGEELKFLCDKLEISQYFHSILGSPVPKNELVKNLLGEWGYEKKKTCLIGDSINDFDAATVNGIDFYGYNNLFLKGKGVGYIHSFS